jgi:hypothetical protein
MTKPAALLALTALVMSGPVAAQQQKPIALPPNNEETQLFRGLFHFHKIEPEAREKLGRGYDYSKLIVVVYGDPRDVEIAKFCRSTLVNGGAVLIAADTPVQLSSFFPAGGQVQITGARVWGNDAQWVDGRYSARPVATPLPATGTSPFSGVDRVATYESSYLLSTKPPVDFKLTPVAAFTPGVDVTLNDVEQRGVGLFPLPFALATTDDDEALRCMVLADPDVFGNRMIYTSGREQLPTDNLKFANNTVQWLKGEGRTRCLFIENGVVQDRFDEFEYTAIPTGPQLPPPPIPNIDLLDPDTQQKVAEFVNKGVGDAQQRDLLNRGLTSFFGSRAIMYAALATLLAFVAYFLFRRRAVFGGFRRTFRPIPRDSAMLGPDVPVGSLGHRRLELLRSADYGPVVRPVVRQLFQDRGMPAEYTGDKLPPVDIDVRHPQFLRDSIRTLWAEVRSAAPITFGRWKQLEPLLAAVRAAAEDDRWRFADPTPRDAAS